jgi:oxygen-independent coproporphyrinogen-3 oxidase
MATPKNTKKLSLYIHIPFCEKKCDYCDFNSFDDQSEKMKDYVEALIAQIKEYSSSVKSYEIDTVYIGGGTPTFLPLPLLAKIIRTVKKCFYLSPSVEFTCEANPKSALAKTLITLKKEGVNRLSLGLQSADDEELKALGRIHTWQEFNTCFDDAKKAGFSNINVDIMFSLPGQTESVLQHTLARVIAKEPTHISCYSLTICKNTPFGQHVDNLNLPNEEEDRNLYQLCNDVLEDAGYHRYEISNFSQNGFSSRHNYKYWNCEEYLGLGAGAHSYFGQKRFSFPGELDTYITGVNTGTLKALDMMDVPYEESVGEYIMLRLRTTEGIDNSVFLSRFRFSFEETYRSLIDKFIASGHIKKEKGCFFLTLEGINISNYIISEFLAHPIAAKLSK